MQYSTYVIHSCYRYRLTLTLSCWLFDLNILSILTETESETDNCLCWVTCLKQNKEEEGERERGGGGYNSRKGGWCKYERMRRVEEWKKMWITGRERQREREREIFSRKERENKREIYNKQQYMILSERERVSEGKVENRKRGREGGQEFTQSQ